MNSDPPSTQITVDPETSRLPSLLRYKDLKSQLVKPGLGHEMLLIVEAILAVSILTPAIKIFILDPLNNNNNVYFIIASLVLFISTLTDYKQYKAHALTQENSHRLGNKFQTIEAEIAELESELQRLQDLHRVPTQEERDLYTSKKTSLRTAITQLRHTRWKDPLRYLKWNPLNVLVTLLSMIGVMNIRRKSRYPHQLMRQVIQSHEKYITHLPEELPMDLTIYRGGIRESRPRFEALIPESQAALEAEAEEAEAELAKSEAIDRRAHYDIDVDDTST